jgi:pantoate--beta-alanine ligase
MSHRTPPPRPLSTVQTVGELRAALSPDRRAGLTIGLVPTMGALHEGHLSLIMRAREQCDRVVVSVFVNPTQFNESTDLERYPRQEERDAGLAARAGADVLFVPSIEEVYPPGFATTVEVLGSGDRMEGAARGAEHFRGVATVVTKLFCMAMPDVAYFGQKDAEQLMVLRRLVKDLNLPVRIEACPTVREPDGLAMSSRNALLDARQRARALALPAALNAACERVAAGERDGRALLDAARRAMTPFGVEPEYVALLDPETLVPVDVLAREALLAIAARIGEVRLIDNTLLDPTGVATARPGGPTPTLRSLTLASDPEAPSPERIGHRAPVELPGKAVARCSA